jgi:hypothetical protein
MYRDAGHNITKRELRRRWALLGMLILASPIGGCGKKTVSWQEELKLLDGRTIVATKTEIYEHGAIETGSMQQAPWETRIQFQDPNDSKKIYTHSIEGASGYVMIDFDNGVPWIVGHEGPFQRTYDGCSDRGYANYITFKWNGTEFQRMPYVALPGKFVKPNTISWTPQVLAAKTRISHADVAQEIERNCRSGYVECALIRPKPEERPYGCFNPAPPQGEKK